MTKNRLSEGTANRISEIMCGKKYTSELNYDSTRGYVHRDGSDMYK